MEDPISLLQFTKDNRRPENERPECAKVTIGASRSFALGIRLDKRISREIGDMRSHPPEFLEEPALTFERDR